VEEISRTITSSPCYPIQKLITSTTKSGQCNHKDANVFFGQICRNEKLENLVNTRKIEGKRARGRQKQGYMASMRRRLGRSWSGSEFIQYKKDRNI